MRRIKSFGVLPSILIVASLLALVFVFASSTKVAVADGEDTSSSFIFIDGGPTMEQINNQFPAPEVWYDSYAPIMVGEELAEGGRVVSGGIIYGLRGTVDMSAYYFREGEMDNLFNCIFQWLKPGAENVLWYEGSSVYIRNKISQSSSSSDPGCMAFADALRGNFGYTMDYNASTITAELLEPYDVLVLPQLQEPGILDNEMSIIVTWVRGGGGLVVLNSSDYFDYLNTQLLINNKILRALGATYLFQHDQINVGGIFYFYARVDESTPIGASYGVPEISVSSTGSLRRAGRSVSVTFQLEHMSGLPGDTLEYLVTVQNGGDDPETFTLTASDTAGWALQIEPSIALDNVGSDGAIGATTMRVTIPGGASLGTDDVITVTATSADSAVTHSDSCVAHAARVIVPTDDAYVDVAQPDSNLGSASQMYVGRFDVNWENAFLKFDLSSIPADATIQEVKLYLWCYKSYAGTEVRAHPVDNDDWSEGVLTWNAAPSFDDAIILDNKYVGVSNQVYSWDVTDFVTEQFAGDKIVSLALTPPSSTPISHNDKFGTKENLDCAPYLAVAYTTPSGGISILIVVGVVVVIVAILGAVLIFVKPF
jgi:hypothetical protein